tara:strand:- start:301 stop:1002 length:702 start_codon:yes stop_codon:yes gene_type:complete
MNKILPIILIVVFSPDAFAGTSVDDFFGALFVFAFLGFVLYILYKILESLGKKAKNKFDDSVIGMSLKVKKEKLRQELDEIEKTKKKPAISPDYVDYLKNLKDTKEFYTDYSYEGIKKEYEEFYNKELTKDAYDEIVEEAFNEAQDIWNYIMSSTGTTNNDRTGALEMSKWCEDNLSAEDLLPIQEMGQEVSQKMSQKKFGMKLIGDIFSQEDLDNYKKIYDTYWNIYQESKK